MNNRIWIVGVTLVSTLFTVNADITGTYSCKGNDPTMNPSAFTQKLVITKQDKAYPIFEVDAGTQIPYTQFGVLTGRTLSIAYQSTNSKVYGVQVFKISLTGKKLSGPFIYANQFDKEGYETCNKISNSIKVS